MMEVFQQVNSKSFGSHSFMLITVEIPWSKSQPIAFSYVFTGKCIKAALGHMRFHDWSPWKVDFADLSRQTDHLAAWLHWSSECVDLIMAALRFYIWIIMSASIRHHQLPIGIDLKLTVACYRMAWDQGHWHSGSALFQQHCWYLSVQAFCYTTMMKEGPSQKPRNKVLQILPVNLPLEALSR